MFRMFSMTIPVSSNDGVVSSGALNPPATPKTIYSRTMLLLNSAGTGSGEESFRSLSKQGHPGRHVLSLAVMPGINPFLSDPSHLSGLLKLQILRTSYNFRPTDWICISVATLSTILHLIK